MTRKVGWGRAPRGPRLPLQAGRFPSGRQRHRCNLRQWACPICEKGQCGISYSKTTLVFLNLMFWCGSVCLHPLEPVRPLLWRCLPSPPCCADRSCRSPALHYRADWLLCHYPGKPLWTCHVCHHPTLRFLSQKLLQWFGDVFTERRWKMRLIAAFGKYIKPTVEPTLCC